MMPRFDDQSEQVCPEEAGGEHYFVHLLPVFGSSGPKLQILNTGFPLPTGKLR